MSKADIDFLFDSIIADTDALEYAKMSLEVIKKTSPDIYDEIIDSSIVLINKALNNSVMGVIARILGDDEWYITNKESK